MNHQNPFFNPNMFPQNFDIFNTIRELNEKVNYLERKVNELERRVKNLEHYRNSSSKQTQNDYENFKNGYIV